MENTSFFFVRALTGNKGFSGNSSYDILRKAHKQGSAEGGLSGKWRGEKFQVFKRKMLILLTENSILPTSRNFQNWSAKTIAKFFRLHYMWILSRANRVKTVLNLTTNLNFKEAPYRVRIFWMQKKLKADSFNSTLILHIRRLLTKPIFRWRFSNFWWILTKNRTTNSILQTAEPPPTQVEKSNFLFCKTKENIIKMSTMQD